MSSVSKCPFHHAAGGGKSKLPSLVGRRTHAYDGQGIQGFAPTKEFKRTKADHGTQELGFQLAVALLSYGPLFFGKGVYHPSRGCF